MNNEKYKSHSSCEALQEKILTCILLFFIIHFSFNSILYSCSSHLVADHHDSEGEPIEDLQTRLPLIASQDGSRNDRIYHQFS